MAEPLIISTSKRDDHQLDLTIQLGPERTEEALHRAARDVSKRAKIPGFRPGKAPYATVLRMFGREALLSQAMEEMGDGIYKEAIEVEKIEPYGQANLEDLQTDPVTFKLVVPLQPEVHLGDYGSIRIPASEVTVSDEDVDQVLQRVADQQATLQQVERPAALGDTVVVDIHGSAGEDTIMDNHDWEVVLQGGEAGWLPGFDDAFVEMAAGDEKSFSLTYPEDSTSRFRGQEATFQATVKQVKAKVGPAIDDEFAQALGEYADLAALRAETREELTRQRTAQAEEELDGKAIDALIDGATFSYPPAAVDEMVHEMMNDLEMRVSRIGYNLQDFLRLQGKTVEAYHDELHPAAERRLKGRLALAELAEAEGIVVTPDESQAELDRIAEGATDEKRANDIRQTLSSESGQWLLSRDVRTRKALARLREIAAGAAPEAGAEAPDAAAPQAAEEAAEATDAEEEAASVDEPAKLPAKKRRTKKASQPEAANQEG